ncbi:hypothetical protein, partial [Yersinia pseudotuberculosis]|uniref:hypothetical protein n=3 Tax=Yersinia pseudotuberculosis TaxID=633 RepID=UPI001A9FFCDA
KGVFITDPKLKALLNPQPSWGFSGHKKDRASALSFCFYFEQIDGDYSVYRPILPIFHLRSPRLTRFISFYRKRLAKTATGVTLKALFA